MNNSSEAGFSIYVFISSTGAPLYLRDLGLASFNYENGDTVNLWRGCGGRGGGGPQSWGLGGPDDHPIESFASEPSLFSSLTRAHSRTSWRSDA